MFYRSKRTQRRGALLLLAGASLIVILGCGKKIADESDPDPNYYKGQDIHRKHAQRQ